GTAAARAAWRRPAWCLVLALRVPPAPGAARGHPLKAGNIAARRGPAPAPTPDRCAAVAIAAPVSMPMSRSTPARLRDEVRTTAVLAAPLVVGHVSTGMIGFIDAVLAGHHGTTTLAAVSVGTAM